MLSQMVGFSSFVAEESSIIHGTLSSSVHPLMDTGCFPVLVIINNAVMNIGVKIFLR